MHEDLGMVLPDLLGYRSTFNELWPCTDDGDNLHDTRDLNKDEETTTLSSDIRHPTMKNCSTPKITCMTRENQGFIVINSPDRILTT